MSTTTSTTAGTTLAIRDFSTTFLTRKGQVTATHGVDLDVNAGEIVGIVGESGCGKSVLAMSIMRLHDDRTTAYAGSVRLEGRELLDLDESGMQGVRGERVAMVFQDPQSSLNPLLRVGRQLREAIRLHSRTGAADARRRSAELLEAVGIPDVRRCLRAHPHELSGGMRQRVMIAMALACDPALLIADEPTTALDVRVQAQILDLLRSLNEHRDMAVLFISHDLAVISELCSRVVVMYLGEVVEESGREEFFDGPLHPYSRGLLAALPDLSTERDLPLASVPGTVPALDRVPEGCRFNNRCEFVTEQCLRSAPPLVQRGGRAVRCWNVDEVLRRSDPTRAVPTAGSESSR